MNLNKNNNPLPPTGVSQPDFSQNTQFSSNYGVQNQQTSTISANEQSLINYNHLTYALYAFSFFTAGLTWVIPLVMNYMKRDDARGTWLYSHFDWQLKTFWYSIFFVIIGWLLIIFGSGGLLLGASINHSGTMAGSVLMGMAGMGLLAVSYFWHFYRLVRGWIALANHRAIP